MQPSLAIIIPAHNEESGVADTLNSLKACSNAAIVLVADNCTDRTASIGKEAGVRVIIRDDPGNRGKPQALAFALDILLKEEFRFFAFVDADSIVEPNFTTVLLDEFSKGAEAVQVKYVHRRGRMTMWQRFLDISFTASNILRPLGRQYWGLSCGIFGNGFALTRETIQAVPFNVDSIVEDLITHIRLVASGRKVRFSTKTTVSAVMPADLRGMRTQRSRWEGGRLAALRQEGPMLCKLIFAGQTALIEPLLDLLLPPLAIHTAAILLLLALPLPAIHLYAWTALAVVGLYTFTTVRIRHEGWKDWAALILAPLYLLWKVLMLPAVLSASRKADWKRTEREGEHK